MLIYQYSRSKKEKEYLGHGFVWMGGVLDRDLSHGTGTGELDRGLVAWKQADSDFILTFHFQNK